MAFMIITVKGTFTLSLPAERGTVRLTSGAEGDDRAVVTRAATGTTEELRYQLVDLEESGAATWYSVGAQTTQAWRPYNSEGIVMPIRYRTSSAIEVKFADFSALSRWGTRWAETRGLSVDEVEWTLTEKTRDRVADEVLTGAVRDATHRAEVLAKAAGQQTPRALAVADPGLLNDVSAVAPGGDLEPAGYRARAMAATGAPGGESVKLSPADIAVSATVHARFQV
ncbi:hypothetical protein JS278_01014 [Acidipropionibacterium virtanenii]|uniref:26 kDa periplasmic immunogenic protein n=2 Tax=Acidipropionibacterium virtanenii TaxID=2057246 RepID=A0A344USE9_9ACTN|nr:hypothetical protein JS278_01014 [Acidipropionibacterium virtanenii]